MLRIIYLVLVSLPFVFAFFWKSHEVKHHEDAYTEEERYNYARFFVHRMQANGHIHTSVTGLENLPQEGGYVMYPNHQGKYDALGIIGAHEAPCTVVMDEKRSHLLFAEQFITLIGGVRLDRSSMRTQWDGLMRVVDEVKAGRRYIIFPEGGYDHNHNNVEDFLPGSFKCAMKAKSPIVPVALIDSYKPFEYSSLRPVHTQIHFLRPLYYDDYKDMNSNQIAALVRERIVQAIGERNTA